MKYAEAVETATRWLARGVEEANTGCYMAAGLSVSIAQGYATLARALRGAEWSEAKPAVFGEPPF